ELAGAAEDRRLVQVRRQPDALRVIAHVELEGERPAEIHDEIGERPPENVRVRMRAVELVRELDDVDERAVRGAELLEDGASRQGERSTAAGLKTALRELQ